jgi:flagellar motor protein MotB
MSEQNAPIQTQPSAIADSTTWSMIALFLILICFFVWLTANSANEPKSGASLIESLQRQFSSGQDRSTTQTNQAHANSLGAATDLLQAAGAKKAILRTDVPGDIRLAFLDRPMFEDGSSALTAEGTAAVRALATALSENQTALRADILVPPQGEVLTALDSVRVAVLASSLESAGAPMGQIRLGLAADKADGLVVGLGLLDPAPVRP